MLRRFEQFQWGPLNATRLNELVDAVIALQKAAAQPTAPPEPKKDRILARITGEGQKMKTDGCEGATPAIVYKFREVQIRTDQPGDPGPNTCLIHTYPEDGASSDRNAILLAFEDEPTLLPGDFVLCHYVGMSEVQGTTERKMVYATTTSLIPAVHTYVIIGINDLTSYNVVREDFPGTGSEVLVNLYEASMWYGAQDDPQNPCATLTPRRLRPGDLVFGYRMGDKLYTCAPTAWTVECQPCGPSGVTPINVMDTAPAKELVAADTVLRGR